MGTRVLKACPFLLAGPSEYFPFWTFSGVFPFFYGSNEFRRVDTALGA